MAQHLQKQSVRTGHLALWLLSFVLVAGLVAAAALMLPDYIATHGVEGLLPSQLLERLHADPEAVPEEADTTADISSTTNTVEDEDVPTRRASLMMVGDVLAHMGLVQTGIQDDGSRNYDHLFVGIASDIHEADIAVANQETVLGGPELEFSGYPRFNSPQEIGDAESKAGFDVILMATNHALDRNLAGVERSLEFWEQQHPEVELLGLARNQTEYDRVHFLEVNNMKFALLNYSYGTNGIPFPADNPYAVLLLDANKIRHDVIVAQEQGADFIVVFPHWGTEYELAPDATQRHWAELFCELGVDVCIGSHPHVLEPVEVLESASGHRMLCYWSLGNFVSTQAKAETMVGGMAKVNFVKDAQGARVENWELWPVVTQRASGTNFSAYKLADYTDELAAENSIIYIDGRFSREFCHQLCEQIFGEAYTREQAMVSGTLEGPHASATDNVLPDAA